jgi:hypothetical protein
MSAPLPVGKPVGILLIVLGVIAFSYAARAMFSGEIQKHIPKGGSGLAPRKIAKRSEEPGDFWFETGAMIVIGGLFTGKGILIIKKANKVD